MKTKLFVYMLFLVLCTSFVYSQSLYSTTLIDGGSLNVNYETSAYDDDILEATSTYTGSLEPFSAPLVCDIDSDGIREVITYSGNTISVIHRDATGFYLEKSFSVSPYMNTTSNDINWMFCETLETTRFSPKNKEVLVIHQGTSPAELSFVGVDIDIGDSDPTGTTDYGNGYMKFAGVLNVQPTFAGVSCDRKTYTDFNGDSVIRTGCAYVKNEASSNEIIFVDNLASLPSTNPSYTGFLLFYNNTISGTEYGTTSIQVDTGLGNFDGIQSARTDVGTAVPLAFVFGQDTGSSIQRKVFYSFFDANNLAIGYTDVTNPSTFTNTRMPVNFAFPLMRGSFYSTDINGDGLKDFCFHGYNELTAQDKRSMVYCGTNSGTELLEQTLQSGDDDVFYALGFYDITNNGDKEVFVYRWSNDNPDNDLFIFLGNDNGYVHPTSVKAELVQHGKFHTMPIVRYNENQFVIIAGGNTFRIDNSIPATTTISEDSALSGLITYDMAYLLDVDFDFSPETMFVDKATGLYKLYYHDPLPLLPTLTLENATRYASGYFGWDIISCLDSPVTIKATECVEGQTTCTYTNSIEFERERLCTTCGGTQPLTCGNWSYASPQISCDFVSSGEKTIQVYMETESKVGLTQALATFGVGVTSTDLSCNTNILTQPATFVDPDQPTPDPEEPDSEKSQLELYYEDWLDTLDESVPRPIQLIASILIMAFMGIWIHRETNGNNYMTILGSLFGAGVSVALGLLAIELVLIVGIGLLVFVFVAYKFDKMGTR